MNVTLQLRALQNRERYSAISPLTVDDITLCQIPYTNRSS